MKKFILISIVAGIIIVSPTPAVANQVVFEIHAADVDSSFWGRGNGISIEKIAQKYIPQNPQTICTVGHKIAAYNNPTDNVIMSIYDEDIPQSGSLLASATLPASALPTGERTFVSFPVSPCVQLAAGATYWFVFTRSGLSTTNGYISGMRLADEYSYSSYWQSPGVNKLGWEENTKREWSLRLDGPSLAPHEPVIIVPGILGTRLNRPSDNEEVWPNANKMIFNLNGDSYLSELLLDAFGKPTQISAMNPSGIVESVLTKNVYGDLVHAFVDASYSSGTDLFTVPYDWRLDLASSTSRLDAVITSAVAKSPTGKVNIIAHSLGGVLVKEYLRQLTDTSFVDKLVLAGVPEIGSPKAFKALAYGDNFGFQVGPIDILNQERIRVIAQNMPAVYQLLPTRSYLSAVGEYILKFTASSTDPLNHLLADRADSFHSTLDGLGFNLPAQSVYRISGCQNPATIGDIRVYPDNKFDIDSIDGDGTVPLVSATYSAAGHDYFALYSMTGINHMKLVGDSRTIGLMKDIITGTSTAVLAEGISINKSDCGFITPNAPNQTTLALSTHSPVVLHIYDAQGRHTGPDANGDIELGIPESTYERIGDNSFAYVPAGSVYKATAKAIASGNFDLKIKNFSGAQQTTLTTYVSVPLATSSTTAELALDTNAPLLRIDNDGDGVIDGQVAPTAVLSGDDLKDFTPPTITTSGTEAFITDSGSGVASSSVVLDDTLILHVSAYDYAGNHASATRYCRKKP